MAIAVPVSVICAPGAVFRNYYLLIIYIMLIRQLPRVQGFVFFFLPRFQGDVICGVYYSTLLFGRIVKHGFCIH